jgi:hypothetical protein
MELHNYVFISYSRQDQLFVDRLMSDLRKEGIEVWQDIEQISPGMPWEKEIERGLKQAVALVYVSSKHSIESAWLIQEVTYYFGKGEKKIIPIIIDEDCIKNMPLFLRQIQRIDFREDYNQALESLKHVLVEIVGFGPSIAAKPKKSKGYAFLSYAEEDSEFLAELRGFLKEHKYGYWDYEESDRDYHSQLFLELEGVIREATATLSILSPAWKRSNWTVKEYLFSEEVKTPVFLLKVRELGPTLVIAGVPYIDFLKDRKKGFEKLAHELKRKGI